MPVDEDDDGARVVALVEQDVAATVAADGAELLQVVAFAGVELAQEPLDHGAAPCYGVATGWGSRWGSG